MTVFKSSELKLYSRVGETREDLTSRAGEAADQAADEALVELRDRYGARLERARSALAKAENRVRELEADAGAKQQEELLSGAGDLLGAFLGGRRGSNPLGQAARRRAATQKAKSRLETASESVDEDRLEMEELEQELAEEIAALTDEYAAKATLVDEVEISLEKTDVSVAQLKLVWIPIS